MKNPPHPADELAEVRAEIARLRLREMALRRQILDLPPDALRGRWFAVELRDVISKKLDPAKLPDAVLRDEACYSESRQTVLHCRANPLTSLHAQGPIFPAPGQLQ